MSEQEEQETHTEQTAADDATTSRCEDPEASGKSTIPQAKAEKRGAEGKYTSVQDRSPAGDEEVSEGHKSKDKSDRHKTQSSSTGPESTERERGEDTSETKTHEHSSSDPRKLTPSWNPAYTSDVDNVSADILYIGSPEGESGPYDAERQLTSAEQQIPAAMPKEYTVPDGDTDDESDCGAGQRSGAIHNPSDVSDMDAPAASPVPEDKA